MSGSGGTSVLVATYPDEATAREDYQVAKDAHAAGCPCPPNVMSPREPAAGRPRVNAARPPAASAGQQRTAGLR
jgi:hypothetical protein